MKYEYEYIKNWNFHFVCHSKDSRSYIEINLNIEIKNVNWQSDRFRLKRLTNTKKCRTKFLQDKSFFLYLHDRPRSILQIFSNTLTPCICANVTGWTREGASEKEKQGTRKRESGFRKRIYGPKGNCAPLAGTVHGAVIATISRVYRICIREWRVERCLCAARVHVRTGMRARSVHGHRRLRSVDLAYEWRKSKTNN